MNSSKASGNDQLIDLYYNSQISLSQISPLRDQSNYQQILLFITFPRHHFYFLETQESNHSSTFSLKEKTQSQESRQIDQELLKFCKTKWLLKFLK